MDPKTWIIRDPQVSARGAKYAILEDTSAGREKISFNLGDKDSPTGTPFGAGTFNGEEAQRKNIDFFLTPEQEASLAGVYEWAVEYLANESERIFRKQMTVDQVTDCLKNPVTTKGDYKAQLRCKIDTTGTYAVRCWSCTGERLKLPDDLRGYKLIPRVTLSHLWFMQKDCGLVFLVRDLQILESETDNCPFS